MEKSVQLVSQVMRLLLSSTLFLIIYEAELTVNRWSAPERARPRWHMNTGWATKSLKGPVPHIWVDADPGTPPELLRGHARRRWAALYIHIPPKWGGISVCINYSRTILDNTHGEDGWGLFLYSTSSGWRQEAFFILCAGASDTG